jgi:hypothetical protein
LKSIKHLSAKLVAVSAIVLSGIGIAAGTASASPAYFGTTISVVHVLTQSVQNAPSDSIYDGNGNLWIEYNNSLVKVSKTGVETTILSSGGQTWPVANPTGNDGSTGYLEGNLAYANGSIYFTDGELGIARVSDTLNHLATVSDIHMVVDTSTHTNALSCAYDNGFFAVDAHGNVVFSSENTSYQSILCLHTASSSATTYSVFQADATNITAIAFGLNGLLYEVNGSTNQFSRTSITGSGAGTWADWGLASEQSAPVRSFAFQPSTGYLFGLDNTGLFVLVPNADGSFTDTSPANYPEIGPGFTGLIAGTPNVLDGTAYTVNYDPNNCVISQEPTQIVKVCSNPGGGNSVIIRPYATSSSNRGPVYTQVLKLAKAIKAANATSVTLTGYTDNQGTAAMNGTLSRQRALEVKILLKKILKSLGVTGVTVTSTGAGDANPVASNATSHGRALNRRVVATF